MSTVFEVKEDSTLNQAEPAEVILTKLNILHNGIVSLSKVISDFSEFEEFKTADAIAKLLSEHSDESAARLLYHLTCLNGINHGLALLQSNVHDLLKVYDAAKIDKE